MVVASAAKVLTPIRVFLFSLLFFLITAFAHDETNPLADMPNDKNLCMTILAGIYTDALRAAVAHRAVSVPEVALLGATGPTSYFSSKMFFSEKFRYRRYPEGDQGSALQNFLNHLSTLNLFRVRLNLSQPEETHLRYLVDSGIRTLVLNEIEGTRGGLIDSWQKDESTSLFRMTINFGDAFREKFQFSKHITSIAARPNGRQLYLGFANPLASRSAEDITTRIAPDQSIPHDAPSPIRNFRESNLIEGPGVSFSGDIKRLSLSPDGLWLAVTGHAFYGLLSIKGRKTYEAHVNDLTFRSNGHSVLGFHPLTGEFVVHVNDPRTEQDFPPNILRIIDPRTRKTVRRITMDYHMGRLETLSFSPNGTYLAVGTHTGIVHVVNYRTGKLTRTIGESVRKGYFRHVRALSWSPDSTRLAIATCSDSSEQTSNSVWRLHGGQKLFDLQTDISGDDLTAISYSPDGSMIVAGSQMGPLYIINSSNGMLMSSIGYRHEHADEITGIIFLNNKLLTSSLDGSLRVWNLPR